jgi:hypothetical protein
MQTSPTRLKKPLYLWLARIVTLGIILASIGIGVSSLPKILYKLNHEAVSRDVFWELDQNGEAIIQYVSSTAERNGVAIGDKVLNYEDDTPGKLGTPVTLHIQRGSSPAQDITFLRGGPANEVVFGGTQLGLPFDVSVTLAFLFILIPVLIGTVGSLLLYWLRSNDWMALLTAVVLANFAIPVFPSTDPVITIFTSLTNFFVFFWFILFPNGKLMPRWSWAIVLLVLPISVYQSSLELGILTWNERLAAIDQITSMLGVIVVVAIIAILYFRYRYMFSPVERQQSKWGITGVIFGLLPLAVTYWVYLFYWYAHQPEESAIAYFFNQSMNIVLAVSITLGIFLSIFRYRLWDVDTFISRAIVYSSLTGILALIGFIVVPLVNYALQQSLGNQSGLLAVLVSALPIAALFNPVRERLQQAVEHRFKPEEMDFENTFIEFTSEFRSLFTIKELSTLLARHAVEQLDIAYASVFLNEQNGHLKHITTICSDQETSDPSLDEKTTEKIKRGQLASPDGNYAQSLVVPLVVPRTRKPSLLGALFLGPRLQGVGYSTPMVKSLKKFGEEVGKAFYVAEMKSHKKQMLLENE